MNELSRGFIKSCTTHTCVCIIAVFLCSIYPLELGVTDLYALFPLAIFWLSISVFIHSQAIYLTLDPVSRIDISVFEYLCPLAMLLTIFPLAKVSSSSFLMCTFAITICLTLFEWSLMERAVRPNFPSFAMHQSLFEPTFWDLVFKHHYAPSMLFPIAMLTKVNIFRLIYVCSE